MQLFAYLAGAIAVAALFVPGGRQTKLITATLTAMWAINGIGYHWLFFSTVNPIARVFGAIFIAQAIAFAISAYAFPDLRFGIEKDAISKVGLVLIAFASIAYPILGWTAGHRYPFVPAFGVAPCPTTIFSIGVLLLGTWSAVRWLLVVPLLWAGMGGSAAVLLNVPQDYGLIAAGLAAVAVAMIRMTDPVPDQNVR